MASTASSNDCTASAYVFFFAALSRSWIRWHPCSCLGNKHQWVDLRFRMNNDPTWPNQRLWIRQKKLFTETHLQLEISLFSKTGKHLITSQSQEDSLPKPRLFQPQHPPSGCQAGPHLVASPRAAAAACPHSFATPPPRPRRPACSGGWCEHPEIYDFSINNSGFSH